MGYIENQLYDELVAARLMPRETSLVPRFHLDLSISVHDKYQHDMPGIR